MEIVTLRPASKHNSLSEMIPEDLAVVPLVQFQKPRFFRSDRINSPSSDPISFAGIITKQSGQYRIQNLSAEGYLIYVGVNGPPDFSQEANSFSVTLPAPLDWPWPGSGIVTLYVVPRKRNSYGCISQNSDPWIFTLSPTGLVMNPLLPPQNVAAAPQLNGSVTVFGNYPGFATDTNPADFVKVWIGTSPPNTSGPANFTGSISNTSWRVNFGTFTPGLYYLAVALYRSADGSRSGTVSLTVVFPNVPNALEPVYTDSVSP